jgi:hypothetical protein
MGLNQAFIGLRQFVSSTSVLEILLVARDCKLSARVRVQRDAVRSLSMELRRLGLSFAVGFEEVRPCVDRSLAREWASFGEGFYTSQMESYLYIAARKDMAERVRNADERCNITETGRLLGYPACCTYMFGELARHTRIAVNPTFFVFDNGLLASWLMNICLLGDDCALITHVPCAADCLGSIRIAQDTLAVLFEADPQLACTYCAQLSGSILYGQDGSYVSFSISGSDASRQRIDRVRRLSANHVLSEDQLIGREVRVSSAGVSVGSIQLLSEQFKYYEFK